jgi:hypothetical protein
VNVWEKYKRNKQRSKKTRGRMMQRKKNSKKKRKNYKEYIGLMNGVEQDINTRCN